MREQFRRAWRYFTIKLRTLLNEQRVVLIMLLLFIVIFEYTRGIRTMTKMTGVSISPYFFSFFMSDYIVASGLLKIMILLGFVVIVCTISKMYHEKYYFIIRTGYCSSVIGDVLFISVISFVYTGIIFLLSIICFLPNLEFQKGWGKIIGTLAYTDAISQFASTFIIPDRIVELYSPINATVISFVLLFLGCIFLGMVIYTANLISYSNIFGIIIVCIFILISPIVVYMRMPELYWISPVTWMSIGNLYPVNDSDFPTVGYAISMLIVLVVVLFTVLIKYSGRWEMKGVDNG